MANSPFIEIRTQEAAASLEAQLKALYPGDAAVAINRGINKALALANTQANREIRSVYNISLKDLNDSEQKMIKKSTESSLTGTILANQIPLSLSKFNPSWTQDRVFGNRSFLTKTQRGATRKVKRGTLGVAVEIIKGQTVMLPSAFQLFNDGGAPVFARGVYNGGSGFIWGQKRLPITKLNTKSVFYAIFSGNIEKKINENISMNFGRLVLHELEQGLNYNLK